jgi:thioesterase domain-containing protein
VLEAGTCARLCASLDRSVPSGASTVVAMNRAGTRTPVFVLPGGGGTALKFRLLAEFLGPDQPLLVIEPRGMHRPGPLDRTVDAMAAHSREEAEARLGPGEPCLMIGYSASAAVAYEALQRMHAAGRPVHLLLLDAPPLRSSGADPARGDPFRPQTVTIRTASRRQLPAAALSSLQYRWFLTRAMWYERFPGRPQYTEVRYRAFLRILGKASRAYQPSPTAFPATLVHVGNDEIVDRTRRFIPDLSVIEVGGDHHTMLQMPEVMNLAAEVAAWSEAALAEVSTPP